MVNTALSFAGLARRIAQKRPEWWARQEPRLDVDRARRGVVPAMRRVVLSEWQKRGRSWMIYIAIITLILHLLLVFAVVYYAGRAETPGPETIPMHLVMLPPSDKPLDPTKPPPPPPPPKKQQAQKPPPPGALASDELGDPNATGKTPSATRTPEAGRVQEQAGEAPPPPSDSEASAHPSEVARPKPDTAEAQSAAPKQDLSETPNKLAVGGALAPPKAEPDKPKTEQLAAKPVDHPSDVRLLRVKPGGATKPTEHREDPDHNEGHKGKYPGPDASRDEYLDYIRGLTMEQINRLPAQLFAGKQGVAVFSVLVRPNGTIVWFSSIQSSGDRQADQLLLSTLNAMSSFPPLPAELIEPDGTARPLTFSLALSAIGKTP
jgi:protein TonB